MKKLFRIIILTAMLMLLCAATVDAYEQASHYIWYTDAQENSVRYDDRNGCIIAYHMGDYTSDIMSFIPYAGDFPLREIGDELYKKDSGEWHDFTTVIIPEGIKRIGKSAFENCEDIVKVVLPESLECIDDGAFKNCTALTDINFPDNISYIGMEAFSKTAITELVVPANTSEIKESAFSNCTSLADVTLHENVASIEKNAFYNTAIQDVFIPDGTSQIDGTAFEATPWLTAYDSDFLVINNILVKYKGAAGVAQIPGNAYHIAARAFSYTGVTGVKFHDKVRSIGDEAFAYAGLLNMTIPETVTYIGEGIFKGSSVGAVEFPSWLTKIPDYTFYGTKNTNNRTLCLHSNITEIGAYAYAESYRQGPVPAHVKKIGAHAFDGSKIKGNIQLEDAEIGEYAFYECSGIQSVNLSGKTNIGDYAFMVCDSYALSVINLGPEVKIGAHAFDWTGIKNIDGVSDEIEYIGAGAFMQTDYWWNLRKEKFIIAGDGNLLNVYCEDETADIVIPEGVKRICGQAFQRVKCNRVILPSTLEVIRSNAFGITTGYGATITEIVLPDKEFIIEPYAFKGCSTLQKINFPKWLKKVPDYAFAACINLTIDSIDGVEEIGENGLGGVTCLKDGVLPKSVKVLGTNSLSGSFDKHIYMEHLPEVIADCPFGFSNSDSRLSACAYVYVHVPEGLLDHNPDWNEYSLVIHQEAEIIDSGDDYVTMYFKSGIADDQHNKLLSTDDVRINDTAWSNLKDFEALDSHTIRLNNASKYMGNSIDFEIMLSQGNYLVKYDPVVVKNVYNTFGDFTYKANGELVSYNGAEKIVTIPTEIEGTVIDTLATDAFSSGEVCIYIPESVKLLKKDFAKHPNTIICFEGQLPAMEIGALGEDMLLFNRLYSHPVANGYTMRKTLTKDSLYSIVDAELYSDTNLHLTLFSDMNENENASLLAKISYADGTQGIYINPVNYNGFRLIRYAQGKKISGAQFFVWDMSGVRPLAYSDALG